MNRRTVIVFCLFVALAFLTSCGSLEFVSVGTGPLKISSGKNSDEALEFQGVKDFYFWGMFPKKERIDVEDIAISLGALDPSYVTVSESVSFKSLLYSVLTLGMYCPVDYKIKILSRKDFK